jgi:hypothetical protein
MDAYTAKADVSSLPIHKAAWRCHDNGPFDFGPRVSTIFGKTKSTKEYSQFCHWFMDELL